MTVDLSRHPREWLFDELLEQAPVAHEWPTAVPTAAQRAIVDAAIADARAHGLTLPKFAVRWVQACSRHQFTGRATHHADGRLSMSLNVNMDHSQLRGVVLHESQHLHDFSAGIFERVSRPEFERRAIAFAAKVMAHRF